MRAKGFLWWMVAVLLVAAALRLAVFGEVPPGLYHDEAHHGLDAIDVLDGHFPLYFPANNGREPLFIYLVALAVGVLGRSPFALRLAAFFVGLLTVAATGAMGRVLFSRRVGLLASAVLAVTLWHVHLSRVGFRAGLLPLFTALTVWQGVLAVRSATGQRGGRASWPHWLATGVFYGLSFYTYMAARFTPVALFAFGLYALAARPAMRIRIGAIRPFRRGVGLTALVALLTVAPLAVYMVGHPGDVLGRPGQVSVFDPAINGGDLWGTLGSHALRTLGMFFVQGDRIWRHNVPWRPIFDPLLGMAFLLGLAVSLRRARRDPAMAFVLIWTGVMSLPTLLAEDAPHFLRAVGVLPVVVFLPALGLDWLAERVCFRVCSWLPLPSSSGGRWSRMVLVALPVLFGLVSTAGAYFGDYRRDPMAGYWFERGAVALAGRVNSFLGAGWDGERMLHGHCDEPNDGRVYIDPALWGEWPQVRFLVAMPRAVTVGLEGEPSGGPVAVFVWPYGDWQRAWALLPTPAEVTVEEGPLSQGDRDPEPYMTYLAFLTSPADLVSPAMARFSGGVELLGVRVTPVGEGTSYLRVEEGADLQVRLRWRATAPLAEDYTVFLHYMRDGERIAQADARPSGGRYPTTLWRIGDVVNDDHFVTIAPDVPSERDVLFLGLWQPESNQVLYLLDEAGNPAGDWIEVPVDSYRDLN